jgi:hypothetical protein
LTGRVSDEAVAALRPLIMGHIVAVAIGIAARLGIADLLVDEPRDAASLARECGAHEPSLKRLLRALASFEVFAELPDGRFSLTPLSEALRGDVPGSLRWIAAMFGAGPHTRAWAEAMHSIRTGQTAAEHVWGTGVFDRFAKDPEEAEIFNRAMTENTALIATQLIEAYGFSRFGTIVDVGGGQGKLLAEVLRACPGARGILFDLADVVAGAAPILEEAGVADRCEVVGGSFFDEVPAGGDLYMMKAIIHDWDDERSETILRNCRERMAAASRVAVIDRVMPERITADEATQRATLMDLNMLVMAGGRERTEREFAALFQAAGLSLASVAPTPSGVSAIEAAPA